MVAWWMLGPALWTGCAGRGDDTGTEEAADPWLELEPVALEAFRPLLRTALPEAVAPTRLVSLRDVPLSFVLDAAAGAAWGLDARYRHDPAAVCTDTSAWPELDPDGERQGMCGVGRAMADRGSLDPGSPLVALAVDEGDAAVWLLGSDGALARANADPLEGNPLDFLRPAAVGTVALGDGPWRMAAGDGLWLADGARLLRLDAAGGVAAEVALDGPVVDLVAAEGVAWALTDGGLWRWSEGGLELALEAEGTGGRLHVEGATAWAALPASGQVWSSAGVSLALEGLAGPLTVLGDRAWVAAGDAVVVLDGGTEVARHAVDPLLDLRAQGTGEVAVLHADGSVAVYVDETELAGREALRGTIYTFFESPKPGDTPATSCEAPATVAALVDQAQDNARLLGDLPAGVGLGIITESARQVSLCEEGERFATLWDRPSVGPGLLIWGEEGEELGDRDAVVAVLDEQAAWHRQLGVPITWLGNGQRVGDDGVDWVEAIVASGVAEELAFFSLDILPEVGSWDPRTKDPVPWRAVDPPTAWRPASAADPLRHDPDGGLLLRPGWTLSAFTLGSCANLFLFECKLSGLGGDTSIDAGDLEVLDLLLWRALAVRSAEGPDHWSFHLPDISSFDYTDGCRRQSRRWEAEGEADCQAARLQGWIFDAHARYASAGLLRWWVPGTE